MVAVGERLGAGWGCQSGRSLNNLGHLPLQSVLVRGDYLPLLKFSLEDGIVTNESSNLSGNLVAFGSSNFVHPVYFN